MNKITRTQFATITLKEFLHEYANVKVQDNWSRTADYYCHSEDSACGNTLYILKDTGTLNLAENVYLEDYDLHEALWEFLKGENYIMNLEKDTILHLDQDILDELEDQWIDMFHLDKENLCEYFEVEIEEEEEEEMETFNEAPYGKD
tara:strand:+ start:117 stop:557 length:441 start_codon:yes stop_codon:yes gene_type:complete